MDVKEATRSVLKTDSRASIEAEGLVGDKYVEISFGSENGARLKDGDRVESDPPLDVSDLIKKTNQILDATQTTMKDVGDTANNLSQVTSKINQGTGTIGGLVNDKTVYRQVAAGATSFQEDMEALKHNFLLRGFFKKRGYEDSSELAKYQIDRLPAGPYLRKFTYDAREIFDKPDTAKLKDPKLFADAGKYMEEQTFSLAVVEAFAGAKGDSDKEKVLSEARALVVRDYFASNFRLDDTKLRTIALGKDSANSYMLEVVVYPPATKRWQVTQGTLAK
jgi:hypothetical protein